MSQQNEASARIRHSDRCACLRRLLTEGRLLRFIEVHSPLSAMIAERSIEKVENDQIEFDGFWSSSLADSFVNGLPDNEVLSIRSRIDNISRIFHVTKKPLIMDADTGGKMDHFVHDVVSAELHGISALIIEDKTGVKQNSLLGASSTQSQDTIPDFCEKIARGKSAQISPDMMIFARIESLILGAGQEDALERARCYHEAGADGIMIHSRSSKSDEIFQFATKFRATHPSIPLICVPTTYNSVHEVELCDAGFNVVIYANQMIRSSCRAMKSVATGILRARRSLEIEKECVDLSEVLKLSQQS